MTNGSVVHSRLRVLNGALHLLQKRFEHLPSWRLKQGLGLTGVFGVQRFPSQKLSSLSREHVAIMVDKIVLFRCILVIQVLQVILEHLFRDFSLSNRYLLHRFAIGSTLRSHMTNPTSEEVLTVVDMQSSMVNQIDLLTYQHHTHVSGHPLSDIVDE